MLSIFDDFTVRVLRQCVRYFKWVTNSKVEGNHLVFSLEKPMEELRIIADCDGNYLFLYTTEARTKSENLTKDALTLRNIKSTLGLLFYI